MRKVINRFSTAGMLVLVLSVSVSVVVQAGMPSSIKQPVATRMIAAGLNLDSNDGVAKESDDKADRAENAVEHDFTGLTAPNFILPTINGRQVELHSLRGKVVIVSFWATWCPPCRRELPLLEVIQQKLAERGVVVLGGNTEDEATARQYMEDKGYSFKTLVDATGEVQKMYGVEAIPTLLVLDRHSQVVAHFVGTPEPQALVNALVNAGVKSLR